MSDFDTQGSRGFLEDLRAFAPYGEPTRDLYQARDSLALDALIDLSRSFRRAEEAMTARVRSALDDHLDRVRDSPLTSRVSLFKAIGLNRQETAHTNALAWLLDPSQPHGFGQSPFEALLKAVRGANAMAESEINALLQSGSNLRLVCPEFQLSPSCRIDVLAEGETADGQPWVVLIEAKVDAQERVGQLADYDAALRAYLGDAYSRSLVLRVFASEEGRSGRTVGMGNWLRLGFRDIAREFLRIYPELRSCPGHPFLRIYLAGLLEDVCHVSCQESQEALLRHNTAAQLEELLEIDHA